MEGVGGSRERRGVDRKRCSLEPRGACGAAPAHRNSSAASTRRSGGDAPECAATAHLGATRSNNITCCSTNTDAWEIGRRCVLRSSSRQTAAGPCCGGARAVGKFSATVDASHQLSDVRGHLADPDRQFPAPPLVPHSPEPAMRAAALCCLLLAALLLIAGGAEARSLNCDNCADCETACDDACDGDYVRAPIAARSPSERVMQPILLDLIDPTCI